MIESTAPTPLSREAALEAFFAELSDEFDPKVFDISEEGDVWIWYNGEYAYRLPLAVVQQLWPEWRP